MCLKLTRHYELTTERFESKLSHPHCTSASDTLVNCCNQQQCKQFNCTLNFQKQTVPVEYLPVHVQPPPNSQTTNRTTTPVTQDEGFFSTYCCCVLNKVCQNGCQLMINTVEIRWLAIKAQKQLF